MAQNEDDTAPLLIDPDPDDAPRPLITMPEDVPVPDVPPPYTGVYHYQYQLFGLFLLGCAVWYLTDGHYATILN